MLPMKMIMLCYTTILLYYNHNCADKKRPYAAVKFPFLVSKFNILSIKTICDWNVHAHLTRNKKGGFDHFLIVTCFKLNIYKSPQNALLETA